VESFVPPLVPSFVPSFVQRPAQEATAAKESRRVWPGKIMLSLWASFLVCAFSSAPLAAAQASPASAASDYRLVTDETGRNVRLPKAVRRIVSLAPSLTETVYAIGLQDLLVGDTDYCDYPPEAAQKPKVGGAINPSIEQIAALRPDLVLVTKSLNRFETVRALDELHIAVYATDPRTVAEIIASTEKLADVLGAPEAGATLAADMNRHLAALRQRLAGEAPKRVLFVVWMEPLISVGRTTFIADALRHAGAESMVDSSQDWPQVSLEEVVRQQPDFLVFAASHSQSAPFRIDALTARPGWSSLEAVKKGRIAVISDAVNRPAPRIVSAIEDLARQLHPDAFAVPQTAPAAVPDSAPSSPPAPAATPQRRTVPAAHAFQSREGELAACAR
jgi:iron complex transport system substrate-binding protein